MAEKSTPPNHLGSDIPSGGITDTEKQTHHQHHQHELPDVAAAKGHQKVEESEEEEDEDMDALIDELESQDDQAIEEEEEEGEAGATPPVPEELLNTSTRTGLTTAEVQTRRKKYGLNQMKEEKENLVLKFLGYFVGPIQFVMEVSHHQFISFTHFTSCPNCDGSIRLPSPLSKS